MFRLTALTLQVLTPLALCGALAAAPPARPAAPPVKPAPAKPAPAKPDTAKTADEIKKNGQLTGGASYWRAAETRFAGKTKTFAAAPLLKPKAGAGALAAPGR